jgi:hypothetical protein
LLGGGVIALIGFYVYFPPVYLYDCDQAMQNRWQVKDIVLAIHNYYDQRGHLPPATVADKTGRPLYSWRVAILPYLDQDEKTAAVWKQFHFDEPWDSDNNKGLAQQMPHVYRLPTEKPADAPDLTYYQVFVGPGTAFERPGMTWRDFPDGLSNIFLVVEAADPVIWSKPGDLVYDPNGPVPKLGGHFRAPSPVWAGRVIGFKPVFAVSLADGGVRQFRAPMEEETLRRWIVRSGDAKLNLQ